MNRLQRHNIKNMIQPFIQDMPDMEMISVTADTLDERMDYLIDEIEFGMKDKDIQYLTSRILHEYNVGNRDWYGQAEAIFNWVRENIMYVRDPAGIEQFRKPIRTVQQGMGDCDDMSILICAMLSSIGHILVLRVIGVESDEPEHIYPLDLIPPVDLQNARAIALDATRSEPMGWQVKENQMKFLKDYELDFESDE